MRRPLSVTASAIVAILGSIAVMVIALLIVASLSIEETKSLPPNSTAAVIGAAVFLVAIAAIGVSTAVGLFRLRAWARIAILIYAGFIVVSCVFSLLLIMTVRIPAEFAGTENTFRGIMAVTFGVPLAIAVWWLIQFNTPSTKAAFTTNPLERGSARPLSITVIAWASLIGSATCFIPILARAPAFLFGAVITGWMAGVIYAVFTAVSLYIGKGLLDLREEARVVAIGWFGFSFLHLSAVTLVPSLRERLFQFQRGIEQNQAKVPFDQGVMNNAMFVSTAIMVVAAIWFLVQHRSAFASEERDSAL